MLTALKRGTIILLGILLQATIIYVFYDYLWENIALIKVLYEIFGFILILWLIKNSKSYSFTLPWIVILLLYPLPGTLLYVTLGRNKKRSKVLKAIKESEKNTKKYLNQDDSIRKEYYEKNSRMRYISDFSGYPITKNNDATYYPLGEIAFGAMLEELRNAEKFIFLEYFIIAKGKMWDQILEVLKEKAEKGVDVRVIYDDFGCISSLNNSYPKELSKYGIKCVVFNKLKFLGGAIMNNRDHRKILVIDGKVAFSGGINIADEYINEKTKYGHWKDNAIKISGDGVWSYTVMFLTIWNAFCKEDKDFKKFKFDFNNKENKKGYIAPYGETPLDEEITGEDIYLNIINQANDYVYIFTPYLIIDNEMKNSLILAAKRGVDVRIVIPGIPDKKIVYTVSQSYVEHLVKGGVKIYKYTPGFIHSKVFVSDDSIATVGTINMDYRSLYLHFECGCYFEDAPVIVDIKKDMIETIEKSHMISNEEAKAKFWKGMWQAMLRLIAPLM